MSVKWLIIFVFLCLIVKPARAELDITRIKQSLRGASSEIKTAALRELSKEVQEITQDPVYQGQKHLILASSQKLLDPLIEELLLLTADQSAAIRASSARFFSYTKPNNEIASALATLARDENMDVRYSAFGSIYASNIQTEEVQAVVLQTLQESSNSNLFSSASVIASAWKLSDAIAPLVNGLKNENPHFKAYSAKALAELGARDALPEMKEQLNLVTEPNLKKIIEDAISNLENPTFLPSPVPLNPAQVQQQDKSTFGQSSKDKPSSKLTPTMQPPPAQPSSPTSIWPWVVGLLLLAVFGGVWWKFLRK
jgi:hypothetical protein